MSRIPVRLCTLSLLVLLLGLSPNVGGQRMKRPSKSQNLELVCKIYNLSQLSKDSRFGKWVAETIPQVIQPETWNSRTPRSGKRLLSYSTTANVLVIYQTAEVHAQVDAFLSKLKETVAARKSIATRPSRGVVPAMHQTPARMNRTATVPEMGSAASPPWPRPKHLFHFTIRYEGEGLIDDSVVQFAKAVSPKPTSPTAVGGAPQPLVHVPVCSSPLYAPSTRPGYQAPTPTASWAPPPMSTVAPESSGSTAKP